MKPIQLCIVFSIVYFSFPLAGAIGASVVSESPDYVRIQTFTLQSQSERLSFTSDPNYPIIEGLRGMTHRVQTGVIKGMDEGNLKWISADPNGYELDIEFSDARYIWKDIYAPTNQQQAERQECWLKPFTARATMRNDRDIPLHIEITDTSCPEQLLLVQYERVLHLLHDLLLTAVNKEFVLSWNYPEKIRPGKQMFLLEFPKEVFFKGVGVKPIDFSTEALYTMPPKELRYHFDIKDFISKGLVLSYMDYSAGRLLSFEYDYNTQNNEVTRSVSMIFAPLKELHTISCDEVVDMINAEIPGGWRLIREVCVKDKLPPSR